jgi:hypothetical protein
MDCSLADPNSQLIFVPGKNAKAAKTQIEVGLCDDSGSNPSSLPSDYLQSMAFPSTSQQSGVEPHFTDKEREHMKLMCHYTLHASHSLTEITMPENRDRFLWSNWITELAFDSDFLLHGILGLSALHLALGGVSRQENIVLAIHHHDLGVSLFRPHLSTITGEKYDAMIAFSVVVAFYAFGILRCSDPDESPIAKLHQVLTLIRGSSVILKADYDLVLRSRWSAMLIEVTNKAQQELSGDMEEMLSTLQRRVATTTLGTDEQITYVVTLEALRGGLKYALTHLFTQRATTLFVLTCPVEFWSMISSRQPLALAILANYAVILHWQRRNIWMEGWGIEIINAVYNTLSPEWYGCIHWARKEMELV